MYKNKYLTIGLITFNTITALSLGAMGLNSVLKDHNNLQVATKRFNEDQKNITKLKDILWDLYNIEAKITKTSYGYKVVVAKWVYTVHGDFTDKMVDDVAYMIFRNIR